MSLCFEDRHLESDLSRERDIIERQGNLVLREQESSLVIQVGDSLLASAGSLENISVSWKHFNNMVVKEMKRVGLTELSVAYLQQFFADFLVTPPTPLSSPRYDLDEKKELKEDLDEMINDPKTRSKDLSHFLNLHKSWIFEDKEHKQLTLLHKIVVAQQNGFIESFFNIGKENVDINNKDSTGMTPLHWAARLGDVKVIELLLEKRAAVFSIDKKGRIPLHYYAASCTDNITPLYKYRKIFLSFLERGCTPSVQDFKGNTPLHLAAREGSKRGVKCILDERVPHTRNLAGETAIHIAARAGNQEICELLCHHGFQVAIQGSFGYPYQVAQAYNHNEVASYLKNKQTENEEEENEEKLEKLEELEAEPFLDTRIIDKSESKEWCLISPRRRSSQCSSELLSGEKEENETIHRFLKITLLYDTKCMYCHVKITEHSKCFGCTVCNGTVHIGSCRRDSFFSLPCASVDRSSHSRASSISSEISYILSDILPSPTATIGEKLEILPNFSKFTKDELSAIYSEFLYLDSDEDGVITFLDFQKILGPIFLAPGIGEHIFRFFDKDHIGEVQLFEYIEAYSVLLKGTLSERIEASFEALKSSAEEKVISESDFHPVLIGMFQSMRKPMHLILEGGNSFEFASRLIQKLGQGEMEKSHFLTQMSRSLLFIQSMGTMNDKSPDLHGQCVEIMNNKSCVVLSHKHWAPMLQFLFIGLRQSIIEAHFITRKSVDVCDYTEIVSFEQERYKSQLWIFHDSARSIFLKLRRMSMISLSSYLLSVGPERILGNLLCGNLSTISCMDSTGRSGSIFFRTTDNRYLFKSLPIHEVHMLKKLLPAFLKHLESQPNSLLTRFYGIHALECAQKGVSFNFVVMENLFFSPKKIDEQYDLKGSSVDRHVDEDASRSVALKDLNFKRKLNLSPDIAAALLEQIESDCMLLEQYYLCDYSLLVGIHFVRDNDPNPMIRNFLGSGSQSMFRKDYGGLLSQDGKEIYFLAIIDTLTAYNLVKRSERVLKVVLNFADRQRISAMRPLPYRIRFQKYVESILK